MRTMLLWTTDLPSADAEIRAAGGAITVRLTRTLVVARVPERFAVEALRAARPVVEDEQSTMSESDARAVRAFFQRERSGDRDLPGAGLPWDAPGFEPPDRK